MPSLAQRPASASTQSVQITSSDTPPHILWTAALLVCSLAAVLVFLVPLVVPCAPVQTVSDSYSAGYNNSVATVCAAGLGIFVLLGTLWWRRNTRPIAMVAGQRLSDAWVAWVVLLSGCVLAFEGWAVSISHLRYLGDAGYFLEQTAVRRDTGRALYTQMEFAYGPLLLLPQVWLSRLVHCSVNVAYFTTLIFESTVGLLMLAWLLDELPIRNGVRKAALAVFALAALTPHVGVNYTYFRFITPYALLFLGTRRRSALQTTLLLSAGVAFTLLISPEQGMAMAVGTATFGLLRAWQSGYGRSGFARWGWPWLAVAVVPVAVIAVLLLTLGGPYLAMAASFSHGTLNLPVGPYPHILVLLFALVWLVPFGLGCMLDLRDRFSARLLALAATSIACIPAALGRSDPVHVVFNGIGLLLLSLVVISASGPRARATWVVVLAVFALWSQYVHQRFYQVRTTELLADSVIPRLPAPLQREAVSILQHRGPTFSKLLQPQPETSFLLNTDALDRIVHNDCIATPIYVSPLVEDQLKDTHHYNPEFYSFWVNMTNPHSEQRSIRSITACPWMLLPREGPGAAPELAEGLNALQGFRLPYRLRNPELYHIGDAFMQNVRQHWVLVQQIGPYELFRQAAPAAPVTAVTSITP